MFTVHNQQLISQVEVPTENGAQCTAGDRYFYDSVSQNGKDWKQPKRQSKLKWVNNMESMYSTEYYAAVNKVDNSHKHSHG